MNLPLDVRAAILTNDEQGLLGLVGPYVGQLPEVQAWISQPAALLWLRGYVPQLIPNIESFYGPAASQIAQYQEELAKQAQGAAPAEQLAPDPVPAAPGTGDELAVGLDGTPATVIAGPGSEQRQLAGTAVPPAPEGSVVAAEDAPVEDAQPSGIAAPVQAPPSAGSHLDDDGG
jgi:hypothetical protein